VAVEFTGEARSAEVGFIVGTGSHGRDFLHHEGGEERGGKERNFSAAAVV
jgi:hypothetical protein